MNSSNMMEFLAGLVLGTRQTSLGRFASNPLFDCNLIPIIRDFTKSTLLTISNHFGQLILFNPNTGESKTIETSFSSSRVEAIKWSPDGCLLATAFLKPLITVWNLHSQRLIHTIQMKAYANLLAWSPDSKTLAVNQGDGFVVFFDVKSGEQIRKTKFDIPYFLKSMSWSPTGSMIVFTCPSGFFYFNDVETGHIAIETNVILSSLTPVVFSRDRSMAVTGNFKRVCVFDMQNVQVIQKWDIESNIYYPVFDLSPDMSMIIRSSSNGQTFISDIKTGRNLYCLKCATELENGQVYTVTWSRDGLLVAVEYFSGNICIYETKTFRCIRSFRVPMGYVGCMSYQMV